jgi:HK97 gp10 family phage protein
MMPRNKDLDALIRSLNAIPKRVREAIDPALDKGADELVGRMKYLSPDDPKTSGAADLKSNIRKSRGEVPLAVRVEASVPGEFDHALAQEYGTVDHDPQPFFWPSVNTLKKRVRSRVDRAIGKATKEAWDG